MTWILAGVLGTAYAQPDVRPGCDPQVMDAIEAKSWLQAQRRITQQESQIFKPDSVIEYSCFNQYLGYLADDPKARRFSENHSGTTQSQPAFPTWTGISTADEKSLDRALDEVVTQPMIAYLKGSFGHTYLGGRAVDAGGSPPPYGKYDCKAMQYVWLLARCMNFSEDDKDTVNSGKYNLDDDDFYDFPWYASNEPRKLPQVYKACTPPSSVYNVAIPEVYSGEGQDKKHGTEYENYTLADENNPWIDSKQYETDPILAKEILELVIPDTCDKSAVIPTGVHIQIKGGTPEDFDEFVCSIPSCSYDGTECVQ